MRKHSRKETNHGTEEQDSKKPWLAHQGRETDYLSGKDPLEEERLQRTSWLAAAEVPKGRADARQTLRREAKHVKSLEETKEGKLAEENLPTGKEHWNSYQKLQKDRKPGGRSHKRRGPRTNGERRPREETDREATTATTDREDSAQKEDPVAKELRCDQVTKEVEEQQHKDESQGGQETETKKDTRKKRKTRWWLRNQQRGDISPQGQAKENRRREKEPSQGRKRKENEGRGGNQNNTREEPLEGSGNREESRWQTKLNNPKEKHRRTKKVPGPKPPKEEEDDGPPEKKRPTGRGEQDRSKQKATNAEEPKRHAHDKEGEGAQKTPKGNCLGPRGGPRRGGNRRFDRGRRAPRDQQEKPRTRGTGREEARNLTNNNHRKARKKCIEGNTTKSKDAGEPLTRKKN